MLILGLTSRYPRVRWLLAAALCGTSALSQPPAKVWTVDLSADKDFRNRLSIAEVSLSPPHVSFISGSKIICDFYSEEEVGFYPSLRDQRFHVLEVDAQTGELGNKIDFPSMDDHAASFPAADGGFVVLAGEELRKFSSSFVPGASYPTPLSKVNQPPDVWSLDSAPGENEVLLYHRYEKTSAEFLWLRTGDLSIIRKSPTDVHLVVRASNIVAITEKTKCNKCVSYFLSDDMLLLDKGSRYSIETIHGEKRGSGGLDSGIDDFARSNHSQRVAYMTGHFKGHGLLYKTNFDSLTGRIVVLDWGANKEVAQLKLDEPAGNPSDGLSQSALALSPDGKYLAVLLHHTLTCYRLP
jgi:hypothetical protein